MVKITELSGHTARVLHMAQSPDGYTVASAQMKHSGFGKFLGLSMPQRRLRLKMQKGLSTCFILIRSSTEGGSSTEAL